VIAALDVTAEFSWHSDADPMLRSSVLADSGEAPARTLAL
jgi:hypothetical protein